VPPQLQRMLSDDLLAAVFPDAAACLENIPGDRQVPDHPLVHQTMEDCLHEAMDLDALEGLLGRIRSGTIACIARDLPEPSLLAHEILNARPYAFLDDAPLEERRAHAVYTRRAVEPSSADDLGALDPAAIDRVRDEAWPDPTNADELHDALMTSGFLTQAEGEAGADGKSWAPYWRELVTSGRAGRATLEFDGVTRAFWIAAERLQEWRVIFSGLAVEPASLQPASFGSSAGVERHAAIRELLRGRIEIAGPVTAMALAHLLRVEAAEVDAALLELESQGVVLRGSFTPGSAEREWCDRRLLARIHRYTLNRLRAEIEPVSTADFMRFLFAWQRVASEERAIGLEGLGAVLTLLDGYELAAGAWEGDVLSARVQDYDPRLLDTLCLTGRIAWGRLSPRQEESVRFSSALTRSTPIALFLREHTSAWQTLASAAAMPALSEYGASVLEVLERRGASFFQELVSGSRLLATQVEKALGELVSLGAATADGFTGLRALLTPSEKRKPFGSAARRRHRTVSYGVETAGRWSLLRGKDAREDSENSTSTAVYQSAVEEQARVLLRRYGVVCKRVIARETKLASWRDLLLCYRRLEARGEIRGGRFVSGLAGEQFALPEAIGQLRAVRRAAPSGELTGISAADPLNLAGIVTPGERVSALATNRVVYRDGIAIAAREKGAVRPLAEYDSATALEIERAILRKRVTPALRTYLGRAG